MKNLIWLILIFAFSVTNSQTIKRWTIDFDVSAQVGNDTIVQCDDCPDVSGLGWSVTVDAEELNADDSQITFGGSDKEIQQLNHIYDFNAFESSSLPFVLNKAAIVDTIRNSGIVDTTYTQKLIGGNVSYSSRVPMFRYEKNSVTSGILRVYFLFFKM